MRDAAEHQALVQSLKEEHFAEDLEPPAESCTWPAATLERWFENGGIGVLTVEEAPSARNGPLRVLGLHAFRSNANILAQQRALSLQSELLKDLVEISLLDAPYVCTAGDEAKAYPIVKKIFPTTKYGHLIATLCTSVVTPQSFGMHAMSQSSWDRPCCRFMQGSGICCRRVHKLSHPTRSYCSDTTRTMARQRRR